MNDEIAWTTYKVCEGIELLSKQVNDPALFEEFDKLASAYTRLGFTLSVMNERRVCEAAE